MSESSKVGTVRLGTSGLHISKIILGCMSYGSPKWSGWVLDEAESMKHFEEAWKLGIFTWDTADVYSNGESEILVGKAIKKLKIPRDEIVVMTKVFFPVGKSLDVPISMVAADKSAIIGGVNGSGLSRKHIFESIKASLKRLDLDYVDVLQCHRFDYNTPIEETMDALHDVVKAGYARYIGMSSCYAYQFQAMQNYAISKNQTRFVSMQNCYNAVYREEEREMVPTCKLLNVGMIPWSPLGRGFLTRPHAQETQTTRTETDRMYKVFTTTNTDAKLAQNAINEAVEKIAKARNLSMAQVATAWVLANETVSAPIIGTTKVESLKELAEATHITLTAEELESINNPYVPRPVYGHI